MPLSLQLFSIVYGGLLVVAGVLGYKLIALGPLAVEGGIFAFLLAVVVSNAVAELHGRKVAQRLVLGGFVPLLLSMALMRLVIALPPSAEFADQAAFASVLTRSTRLMTAGLIAYGTSQFLNVTLFSWLRGRQGSRGLWLRAVIAGLLAQLVDTLIFITVAFAGVYSLAPIIGGQLVAKGSMWLVAVPLLYGVTAVGRWLDRRHSVSAPAE